MDAQIADIQRKIELHQLNIAYLQPQIYELTGQNAKLREQIENGGSQAASTGRSGGGTSEGSKAKVDPLAAYKKPKEKRERWEYVDGKWESKWTEDWE